MKPTLTRGKYTEKIMQFADHLGFLYIKHLVYHKKKVSICLWGLHPYTGSRNPIPKINTSQIFNIRQRQQ